MMFLKQNLSLIFWTQSEAAHILSPKGIWWWLCGEKSEKRDIIIRKYTQYSQYTT